MDLWQLGPDVSVSVDTSSGNLSRALDTVFGALRSSEAPARRHISLGYTKHRIIANSFPVLRVPSDHHLAPVLESVLTHLVSEVTRSRVGFHAGLVEINGRAILLPGERGSGKSTASLWLARRRGVYCGDDLCYADESNLTIAGLPKAVTLKAGSFPFFPETETHEDSVRGSIRYFLPERHARDPKKVHLIVFPQYAREARTEARKLDRPIAALALVQQSFGEDARRLELAAQLSNLPCHVIHYSTLESLEDEVMKLL